MKKTFEFSALITVFILLFLNTTQAVNSLRPPADKLAEIRTAQKKFSIDDLMNLDRREMESKMGRKLKLKERLGLKLVRSKIKRARKLGKTDQEIKTEIDADESKFSWRAFLLGLIFPVFGILLSFAFFGKEEASSAWLGTLSFAVVIGVGILVLGNSMLGLPFGLFVF